MLFKMKYNLTLFGVLSSLIKRLHPNPMCINIIFKNM